MKISPSQFQAMNTSRNQHLLEQKRRGLTLMELLLVTALVAVLAGATTSMIYWQMRTQVRVTQTAMQMNKLVNTQMLMRKVLRSRHPASLTVNLNKVLYQQQPLPFAPVELFSFSGSTLTYGSEAVLENAIATFSALQATNLPVTDPTQPLASDATNLIKIELAISGKENHDLNFIVRPRGMMK